MSREMLTLAPCGYCRLEGATLIARSNCPEHDVATPPHTPQMRATSQSSTEAEKATVESGRGHSEVSHHRFTFCQYWPSATWWATYMDGELLDVYPTRDLAEGYCSYMNGRAA